MGTWCSKYKSELQELRALPKVPQTQLTRKKTAGINNMGLLREILRGKFCLWRHTICLQGKELV